MTLSGRNRTIILSSIVLGVGIIHLGVGIGIIAKYQRYNDIFQQQIGLCGYNIVIGLFTMFVGILGLVAALHRSIFFSKLTAIASFILGILVLASLITALALSGSTAGYMFDTMTDHMNRYAQRQDSLDVINKLQTTYECCGVSLWLDWARISLGVPIGGGGGAVVGRRRREETSPAIISPLVQSIRQKRQNTPGSIYNLPSQYTFNMPLSCCRNGGIGGGASVGGFCVFLASNGTGSFFLEGCYRQIANRGASQITGIAVINTFLLILAFVNFAKLITVFRQDPNKSDIYNQNQTANYYTPEQVQQQQQQQYQYDPYYATYNNQNAYYVPNDPNYKMYL